MLPSRKEPEHTDTYTPLELSFCCIIVTIMV